MTFSGQLGSNLYHQSFSRTKYDLLTAVRLRTPLSFHHCPSRHHFVTTRYPTEIHGKVLIRIKTTNFENMCKSKRTALQSTVPPYYSNERVDSTGVTASCHLVKISCKPVQHVLRHYWRREKFLSQRMCPTNLADSDIGNARE